MKKILGVGLLALSLALTGCTGEEKADEEQSVGAGSLEVLAPQSGEISYIAIGKTMITDEAVQVYESPDYDRATVGRLPSGIYEVYDMEDGFFEIVYFDGKANNLGWIPNHSGLTLGGNADKSIAFDKK